MSRVSVIIPTFNRSRLLQEAIRSVVEQEEVFPEIIIVDDGSTDDTGQIVKTYYGDRVSYIWQQNLFLGAARNTGLRHASGEFVLFLDSDDLLLPRAIYSLLEGLRAERSMCAAYGEVEIFSDEGVPDPLPAVPNLDCELWERLIAGNFIRSSGAVLIRREHLLAAGAWDSRLPGNEDWDMWLRLAEIGNFIHISQPVLKYRVHKGSMSATPFHLQQSAMRFYRKTISRTHTDLERRYLAHRYHKELYCYCRTHYRRLTKHLVLRGKWSAACQALLRTAYFIREPLLGALAAYRRY